MGVIGRLHRVAALLDDGLRAFFAEEGLAPGDFDVLATLRRSGEPYLLSPSKLSAHMMVTSGAVTKRVDRLVRAGWVTRDRRQDDARGRWISLTPEGLTLVERLLNAHVANEDRLLRGLDRTQRGALAMLLSTLLRELDPD